MIKGKAGRSKLFRQNIGKRYYEARIKNNLTQEELAAKSGLSVEFINKVENGKLTLMFREGYILSEILKTTLDELIKGLSTE
jgi:transcriptional regulator with XRE-family HTH domain